ncbi:hypothetical protein, partial [Nocardiopsis sp. CNR-923]|uniref:hypothetical protein n=1 Tax=Nocardiopsis sp. CNR-923 TaxID=1904965 RepID=UPI0021CC8298
MSRGVGPSAGSGPPEESVRRSPWPPPVDSSSVRVGVGEGLSDPGSLGSLVGVGVGEGRTGGLGLGVGVG